MYYNWKFVIKSRLSSGRINNNNTPIPILYDGVVVTQYCYLPSCLSRSILPLPLPAFARSVTVMRSSEVQGPSSSRHAADEVGHGQFAMVQSIDCVFVVNVAPRTSSSIYLHGQSQYADGCDNDSIISIVFLNTRIGNDVFFCITLVCKLS